MNTSLLHMGASVLLSLLFSLTHRAYAQGGTGGFLLSNFYQAKEMLTEEGVPYTIRFTDKGTLYIRAYLNDALELGLVFDKVDGEDRVVATVLFPKNPAAHHAFIEYLNATLVRKSKTEWLAYAREGAIITTKMMYVPDVERYVFLTYISDRAPLLKDW